MNINTSAEAANDDGVNKQSNGSNNVKTRLYKKYVEHITNDLSPSTSNKTIEDIIGASGSISADELTSIMAFKGRYSEFDEIEEKDIQLSSLQRELRHEFMRRGYIYQKAKEATLKEYDMSSKEYDNSGIADIIKELDISDASQLSSSKNSLHKLIESYFKKQKKEIPRTRPITILSGKFQDLPDRIKVKINKLSGSQREEFINEIEYFSKEAIVGAEQYPRNFATYFDTLIEAGIFSSAEKVEIIKTFIPFITAKEAQKLSPSLNIESLIVKELEKNKTLQFAQLNKETKEEIVNKIDKDEFLFSVDVVNLGNSDTVEKLLSYKNLEEIGRYYNNSMKNNLSEGSFESLEEFQDALAQSGKVESPQLFKKENIIELSLIDKKGANERERGIERKIYYTISDDGSDSGHITLVNKGEGEYTSKATGEQTQYAHKDIIDLLKSGTNNGEVTVQSMKVLSQETLETKIASGDIIENLDAVEFKSQSDLEARKKRKKDELIETAISENNLDKYASDDEADRYLEENGLLDSIDEEISEYNLSYLKTNIDKIDEKGSGYGLEIGTVVDFGYKHSENTKTVDIFCIVETNEVGIKIEHVNGKIEELSYEEFFNGFKGASSTRVAKINSPEDFIDFFGSQSLAEPLIDKWKGISIQDGHLTKKILADGKEELVNLDFIVGEKSFFGDHNLIKISKIEGNYAEIHTGKYDYAALDDKGRERFDKEGKQKSYSVSAGTQRISLAVLSQLISKSGGIPKDFDPKEEKEVEEVKRHGSLASRFLNRASVFDLISGGKLILDSIESKLKEGSEEIAANLALKAGNMIPGMATDMRTRVEQAQRKRVDEFKDRLNTIDSGDATQLIEETLLNKDAPESEKEACLLFMVEKYGTLYEKKALHKHAGKYLWYTAFGGRVGDEMFMETKQDAEDGGINFSEHDLMIRLLGKQCKRRAKPYRRSKLHKEYKAMMAKGKEDERGKGLNDANEKRTVDGRLKQVALGELEDGAYANAMGALKSIIGKGDGGDLKKLTMLPFVMNMSGVAYDYDQDMVNGFFGEMAANGTPIIGTFLTSTPKNIDVHNKAVVEVAKTLAENEGGDYNSMYKEALKLYGNARKTTKDHTNEDDPYSPEKRVKATVKFYEKYGDELNRIMNMLNTRKEDTTSKYERLIWENRNNSSSVFKDYYAAFYGFANGMMDYSKDDDTLADAFTSAEGPGSGGISGMAARKVFYDTLKSQSGGNGYRMKLSGPMIENEFIEQLKTWVKHPDLSEEQKRSYMEDYIAAYLYAMLENLQASGGRSSMRESYRGMKFLDAHAEDFDGLFGIDFKDEPITNKQAKGIVEKYTQQLLSGGGSNLESSFKIPTTINNAKTAANDILH